MSTGIETHTPAEHAHTHPSDAQYVKVAALLAVITGAEVSTYFWKSATTPHLVMVLFPMMIIKFGVVVAYFMHLRYDHPLFRRVFVGGLVLAVIVFCIAMTTFGYWTHDYLKYLRR